MKLHRFLACFAVMAVLPSPSPAQTPNTLPVVVDNRAGSTYHQVTAPTDFWQHTPFSLATGQAYVIVNSTTGALISPTSSAFFTANPPPGGGGGATTNASLLTSGTLDNARLSVVPVAKGGTGASDVETAKATLYTGMLRTVSTVGDGGSNSLEAIPTTGLAVPQFIMIYVVAEDTMEGFLLVNGTDAQDRDINNTTYFHVRPLDYNASTNTKVWVRKD